MIENKSDFEEDQNLNNNLGMETFRSYDDGNLTSERMSSLQNESDRDGQHSINDYSFEDDVTGNILKTNELKDDR